MTLIAAFQGQNSVALTADLLISSSVRPQVSPILPLAPDFSNNASSASRCHVVRLQQKLILLSERICIAYAGRPDRAEHIIRRARQANVQPNDINRFVEEELMIYPISERRSISFLIAAIQDYVREDGASCITLQAFNHDEHIKDWFGQAVACGSGAKMFVDALSSYSQILKHRPDKNSEEVNHTNISLCYGTVASLLGKELFRGPDLLNTFGGFFEVAIPVNFGNQAAFKKIDKASYLFWEVDISKLPEIYIKPQLFLAYAIYHHGHLVTFIDYEAPGGLGKSSTHIFSNIFGPELTWSAELMQSLKQVTPEIYVHFLWLVDGRRATTGVVIDSGTGMTTIEYGATNKVSVDSARMFDHIRYIVGQ